MATTRRKTRRKSTRKKRTRPRRKTSRRSTARRSTRRKTTRRKTTRKKRRKKKNPSMPWADIALATLSGLTMAAADFGLRGVPQLDRKMVGGIELAAGLLAGGLASGWSPGAGLGLVGSGAALGGAHLASALIEKSPSADVGAIRARVGGRTRQLNAVQGDAPALGAVRAPVGRGRRKATII